MASERLIVEWSLVGDVLCSSLCCVECGSRFTVSGEWSKDVMVESAQSSGWSCRHACAVPSIKGAKSEPSTLTFNWSRWTKH